MDVPSAPAETVDSDPSTASTPDNDQEHGEDRRVVLSGRATHEFSNYWGRLPANVGGQTRGQSHCLEGSQPATSDLVHTIPIHADPESEEAMLAATYEWTMSGGNLTRACWTVL